MGTGQGAPLRESALRCLPDGRHGLVAPFEALGGEADIVRRRPQKEARVVQRGDALSLPAALARRRLVLHGEVVAAPDQILPADARDEPARAARNPARHRFLDTVKTGRAQADQRGLLAQRLGAACLRRVVAQRLPLFACDDLVLQHRPQSLEQRVCAHRVARSGGSDECPLPEQRVWRVAQSGSHCPAGRSVPADTLGNGSPNTRLHQEEDEY